LTEKEPKASVQVGDKAPLFTLPDGRGTPVSLQEILQQGKKVVLFFYPKDFTPGCVRENKAFRDQYSLFYYADCEILGISADSSSCHQRFAEKFNIPFKLLSDCDNIVRNLYGVPDLLGGLQPGRVTYVIEPINGTVMHIYNSSFSPHEHIVQSLSAISQMLLLMNNAQRNAYYLDSNGSAGTEEGVEHQDQTTT
jgi:peroxiredoxin Q/BCP